MVILMFDAHLVLKDNIIVHLFGSSEIIYYILFIQFHVISDQFIL